MDEREGAKALGRNLNVRDLAGHADDEGEVGEVHIARFVVAGEIEAAIVRIGSGALVIEGVGVTQCEHGVNQYP